MIATSTVQAASITGWTHGDNISAEISTSYNSGDSSLLLTVTNTSPATSAYLRGLLFSAADTTLNLRDVTYYSNSISSPTLNVTENWSLSSPDESILNAEPMKYYDGLNTALFTGDEFGGGNPNLGLQVGWTADFLFDVDGTLNESMNNFIGRFQSINYPGMVGSDSDFAYPVPTPIPGAVWLLGAGIAGLAALRRRIRS
ncbi:VPLPA-CTERM sorting domain-containing protein [Desulfovibrio sp. JC022]|uniref:VPLPA-CTERM sorting domain-containing protein n=1 Tax=Desulfovibrio sp. JC022 TaxID=2593642 RepID=UPI001EF1A862|nr:VPLPA-CTERM sorting domain-containing protein [Desulfovibrio sp. JC022]